MNVVKVYTLEIVLFLNIHHCTVFIRGLREFYLSRIHVRDLAKL